MEVYYEENNILHRIIIRLLKALCVNGNESLCENMLSINIPVTVVMRAHRSSILKLFCLLKTHRQKRRS